MLVGMTRSLSNAMPAGNVCLHPTQPLEDCINAELVPLQLAFGKAFTHKKSLLSSKDLYETLKEKGKQKCFAESGPKWVEKDAAKQV